MKRTKKNRIKRRSIVFFFVLISFMCVSIQAQNKDSLLSSEGICYDLEKEKDIADIIKNIINGKRKIADNPDKKIKDTLENRKKILFAFVPAIGYALHTGVTGLVSANISFYTGDLSNTNISSISITPQVSFNYPLFMIPLNFNIWSGKNNIDITGDLRYYQYPTNTYGLGGYTKLSDANLIDYNYVRSYINVLKKISNNKVYVGGGYNLDYHFGIEEKGSGTDFELYNEKKRVTTSSGINVAIVYDSRSNQNYPEKASYANIQYRFNSKYLGSDSDWQSAFLEYKRYFNIPGQSHNVLALWSIAWFAFGGKPPYFDLPSTGWDNFSNTGRGYIQGRLRGPAMLYLETEYRFRILKNGLLGGNIFINGQSISERELIKFETILPGAGFGLRLKLNKTSRVNYAVDYGWGLGGSRGLFFNISEVF